MRWLRRNIGELSIALGVAHLAYGIREHRGIMPGIARDGWWMAISGDEKAARSDFFWFMVAGISSISEGILIRHSLKKGHTIPRSYGLVNLGVMATIGAAVPNSGAPAAIPLSLLMLTGGEPKDSGKG